MENISLEIFESEEFTVACAVPVYWADEDVWNNGDPAAVVVVSGTGTSADTKYIDNGTTFLGKPVYTPSGGSPDVRYIQAYSGGWALVDTSVADEWRVASAADEPPEAGWGVGIDSGSPAPSMDLTNITDTVSVRGIFGSPYGMAEVGVAGQDNSQPVIRFMTPQALNAREGDAVVVDREELQSDGTTEVVSTSYKVGSVQPDGYGVTECPLYIES